MVRRTRFLIAAALTVTLSALSAAAPSPAGAPEAAPERTRVSAPGAIAGALVTNPTQPPTPAEQPEETTTTTTAPAPTTTTTAVPAPPEPDPAAVAAAEVAAVEVHVPAPGPNPDPGTAQLGARITAAYEHTVAPKWRHLVGPLELIDGATSLAWPDGGRIQISTYHAQRSWDELRFVIAHEVAHLIAFSYGTDAYHGAGPAGFPLHGTELAEERWADCVAVATVGRVRHDRRIGTCDPAAVTWTTDWLNSHP